ncbi:uncharacterized protein LOC120272176 [Dioscorea cayenensis subsp. rotundata]|uniref:Uncharacterized protein LOC120272176 n=1 Tax=Dioscorea cayennensis subsp. rotundata TaxID=55577 RepID=A0AB40C7T1_DIOCR|nr:uncharacterized protein LOC120272176 [Dioscorea cayenensis subsp. rotundata]
MAAESLMSLSQPCVPVFKGEDYGRWSLRMKTVFRSKELWELVEKGLVDGEDEVKQRETKKKDAKAMCLIQQPVDGPILDRIEAAETAHEAWEIIKKQYQGSSKMMIVRKQALRQSFETLQMEDNEIRLRVAVALEESKDITKLTLDELSGSLQAHEVRVNRSSWKAGSSVSEKALHVKGESSGSHMKDKGNSNSSSSWTPSRGRGRGFIRGRRRG